MKLTDIELNHVLDRASKLVPVGSQWIHYKGGRYEVLNLCVTESKPDEVLVVYCSVKTGVAFARPLHQWENFVPEGQDKQCPRYVRVKEFEIGKQEETQTKIPRQCSSCRFYSWAEEFPTQVTKEPRKACLIDNHPYYVHDEFWCGEYSPAEEIAIGELESTAQRRIRLEMVHGDNDST